MKSSRVAPLVMGFALAGALAASTTPAAADKSPACVKWSQQVVATAVGYNHVVTIDNQCDRQASCSVSTDVAPDAIQASVQGKQRTELVTFRGSPSRVFKAKVDCKLE